MRIALVGLGGMGTTHYLNYLHIPDVQVVAAVGKSEQDRARAAQWGLPLYDTLTELCAAQQVDLADICAPTFLHKPLALEAIRHGLHVITEKPIALCLTDAQEMYDAADRAGVQLYVAQVLQFTREVETLHQVMADRRYGKPLDACFERLSARPGWVQGSWMFQKEKSGLLPFDLHIHDLDMMVSIFGEPRSMDYTSCGGPEAPCREQYRFRYTFAGGITASAEAAWFNACLPFTARWRVYFERGLLVCDGGLTGYGADGDATVFDVEDPVKVECGANLPPSGWFLRELSHFVARAKENRPSERVPREQVLSVLGILEKIV